MLKINFRKEWDRFLCVTFYVWILSWQVLPAALLVVYIIEFISEGMKKYTLYFLVFIFKNQCLMRQAEFYLFFIFSLLVINMLFIRAHVKFQNNFSSRHFQFKRDKKLISDVKFISTWLFMGGVFHTTLRYFEITDPMISFISTYIILNTIFYMMVRRNWFGYALIKRTRALKF